MIDWILAHRGEWPEIIRYWDAFLALEPGNATGYFERSGTHFHAGHKEEAKRDCRKACDLGLQEACVTLQSRF
jgi:hypothetical protein